MYVASLALTRGRRGVVHVKHGVWCLGGVPWSPLLAVGELLQHLALQGVNAATLLGVGAISKTDSQKAVFLIGARPSPHALHVPRRGGANPATVAGVELQRKQLCRAPVPKTRIVDQNPSELQLCECATVIDNRQFVAGRTTAVLPLDLTFVPIALSSCQRGSVATRARSRQDPS